MSILIKGMEMPKNCGECPIYEHLSIHGNTFRFCRLTRMETNPTERRDDCPLIEVPTHGKWIWKLADNGWADNICSVCGYTINDDIHVHVDYNYCPNCGADMREAEGEE